MAENVSRRDFLRRVGKDAVDTGARIIPGGQLAKKFVEADKASDGDFVPNPSKKWWDKFIIRQGIKTDIHSEDKL